MLSDRSQLIRTIESKVKHQITMEEALKQQIQNKVAIINIVAVML